MSSVIPGQIFNLLFRRGEYPFELHANRAGSKGVLGWKCKAEIESHLQPSFPIQRTRRYGLHVENRLGHSRISIRTPIFKKLQKVPHKV